MSEALALDHLHRRGSGREFAALRDADFNHE
jgi:hypothetical protein